MNDAVREQIEHAYRRDEFNGAATLAQAWRSGRVITHLEAGQAAWIAFVVGTVMGAAVASLIMAVSL